MSDIHQVILTCRTAEQAKMVHDLVHCMREEGVIEREVTVGLMHARAAEDPGGLPGAPPGPVAEPTGQGAVRPDVRGTQRPVRVRRHL